MWLSDLSVKRPVLATVMSLIILLFGALSFVRLPVREYPNIDPPVVSVITVYRGAAPETVEASVTEPLEEELASLEGVKSLTSSSREQVSSVVIEFELSRDIEEAAQDVRDRVARARDRLPEDVNEPLIAKQDADAQPILWIGLSGSKYTMLQLSDYADRYLKDALQTVKGVGRVIIGGRRQYAMRLWLDPRKMAARGVSQADVASALRAKNIDLPSGRIEAENVEFPVKVRGELDNPDLFNRMVVKTIGTQPIYFSDIGHAEIGAKDDRSMVRMNGQPGIGLGIVKQSRANPLEIATAIRARIAQLETRLPPGMKLNIAFDATRFIERSVNEVKESLLISVGLVVLVMVLFLRNLRASIIPALAIPVSILGTFAVMLALNFTINTFTLLALTLAIGLVVDDAIVVLENIVRHIAMGKSTLQAALDGSREIAFAILATTITLVAVFVPIGFLSGVTGRLFFEFAISVATAVLLSGFVSLSLTPMLCAKLLKANNAHSENSTPKQTRWSKAFDALLTWALAYPKTVLSLSLILVVLSFGLTKLMPSEFLPLEDRGNILTFIKAPEGSTMAYTDRAIRQAEKLYRAVPEIKNIISVLAFSSEGPGQVNQGIMFTTLKPWEERKVKQQAIVNQLLPKMMAIPEAFVFPINPPSGPSSGSRGNIQIVLQGFDMDELSKTADAVLAKARQIPGIVNLDTNVKLNKPQLEVKILRDRAEALGVSPETISQALETFLGGRPVTDFKLQSKRYDVMLQADKGFRNTPDAINTLMVAGRGGQMIPLANVVKIEEKVAPNELDHYNRLRAVTITGSTIPFLLPLGAALDKFDTILKETMPPSVQYSLAGESREFKEAGMALIWTFGISIVFIYLVLAAQFESFRDPFIILLTVPLSTAGAFYTLFFSGLGINVYSQIGLVLLIGLVTKNGILIVEYANHLRDQGLSVRDAVFEAAKIRLRPILMTSVATIFGALPIAFALGAGSESRQALGVAIVGGLLFSTLLTVLVVPVVYQLLHSRRSPA